MNKYKNIIDIVCEYYNINQKELLRKKENLYLIILLMKNFRCLNEECIKVLGNVGCRSFGYNLKKAEEKILINKYFRDEYFLLEDNIKEKIKNA